MAFYQEACYTPIIPPFMWDILTAEQKEALAKTAFDKLKNAVENANYQAIADTYIESAINEICKNTNNGRNIGDLDKIVIDIVKTALLKMKLTNI